MHPAASVLALALAVAGPRAAREAHAAGAARVVVLPSLVGDAAPPGQDVIAGIARGLAAGNPRWTVVHGTALAPLVVAAAPPLSLEDLATLIGRTDQAAARLADAPAEAAATLAEVVDRFRAALAEAPRPPADHAAAYRAEALLVTARLAAGEADVATAAAEVALRYPGRRPRAVQGVSAAAADLLERTPPPGTPTLIVESNPEACAVVVDGQPVGDAPLTVPVLPGISYRAFAECARTERGDSLSRAPTDAERAAGAALRSRARAVGLATGEVERKIVLDVEFETVFAVAPSPRMRFASGFERREMEGAYVPRLAERLGADAVVMVTTRTSPELGGGDWLSATLYLRSGYRNRRGYARVDPARATALGRYLATGQPQPGVLPPEQAVALVAASAPASAPPALRPWYADPLGWSLLGVGVVGVTAGLVLQRDINRRADEIDAFRGPVEERSRMSRELEHRRFWSGVTLASGAALAATGIVVLSLREYEDRPRGTVLMLGPSRVGVAGRF